MTYKIPLPPRNVSATLPVLFIDSPEINYPWWQKQTRFNWQYQYEKNVYGASTCSAVILLWTGRRICHQFRSFLRLWENFDYIVLRIYIFFSRLPLTDFLRFSVTQEKKKKKKLSMPPNGSACRKKMEQRMERKWFSIRHKSQEIKRCWWPSWRWRIVLPVYWCREQTTPVPNCWPQNNAAF